MKVFGLVFIRHGKTAFSSRYFSSLTVDHNKEYKIFYMKFEIGSAYIKYNIMNDNVLDMYKTYVPADLRGKGLARILATEAFQYVVENQLKMKLTCWYLQDFYKENQIEYRKYVVQ